MAKAKRKARRKQRTQGTGREFGALPTPEQVMKGDAVRDYVTHAETATKAMAHRVVHDPIKRWEKDGKLNDRQIATIEQMQTLWQAVHGEQSLTARYSEPLGLQTRATGGEMAQARQIALRDDLRDVEAMFDGVRQWYSVFERICRFGMSPVEVCGDRERALTTVRFVADFIAARRG